MLTSWVASAGITALAGCLPTFQHVDSSEAALYTLSIGEWVAVDLHAPAISSDGSAYE